jgi:hypothetical protein
VLSAAEKTPDALADEVVAYLVEQGICPVLEDKTMPRLESLETA